MTVRYLACPYCNHHSSHNTFRCSLPIRFNSAVSQYLPNEQSLSASFESRKHPPPRRGSAGTLCTALLQRFSAASISASRCPQVASRLELSRTLSSTVVFWLSAIAWHYSA